MCVLHLVCDCFVKIQQRLLIRLPTGLESRKAAWGKEPGIASLKRTQISSQICLDQEDSMYPGLELDQQLNTQIWVLPGPGIREINDLGVVYAWKKALMGSIK